MNILCVIVGKIFDRHHQLTDSLELSTKALTNTKKIISENKVKHDSEINKRKKSAHEIEVKLNKNKKRVEELSKINEQAMEQANEEIKNLRKIIEDKDLLIKDYKSTIKNSSNKINKLETEKIEADKKIENFKFDKRKVVTELEKKITDGNKKCKNLENKLSKCEASRKEVFEVNAGLRVTFEREMNKVKDELLERMDKHSSSYRSALRAIMRLDTSSIQIKKKVPKDTFERLRSKQKRIMAEMETSSNKGDMGNIIAACDKLVDEIDSINKDIEAEEKNNDPESVNDKDVSKRSNHQKDCTCDERFNELFHHLNTKRLKSLEETISWMRERYPTKTDYELRHELKIRMGAASYERAFGK